MLFHRVCKTPVEVVEDSLESEEVLTYLTFYCKVCEEVVILDHDLFVVDTISYLEEISQ